MREKPVFRAGVRDSLDVAAERLRADLEVRGVDPAFSGPLARRLVALAPDLSPAEYAAVLDGVAVAHGVHREIARASDPDLRQANEVARLMDGFGSELRKLDEGLRMLTTYLARMGALLSREGTGKIH